ncbi:uncharacterized protein LOC113233727, partial [Hyposmocoma kahamanoa]|uniref:uncharacterized protein LOC113233727 n=1 Tax=Hyposmocoma kahamanoa TaxID=1477025 RepID=UPI000E6D93FF
MNACTLMLLSVAFREISKTRQHACTDESGLFLRSEADGQCKGKTGAIVILSIFQVKYLGQSDAKGLWGIKHTRKPVDLMVAAAKALPPDQILPIVKLKITVDGVFMETVNMGLKKEDFQHMSMFFNIESISYGVQDLVYTRVFSMIIVKDTEAAKGLNPFECHAFVCES